MKKGRDIRAFDYVNHGYEPVRDALRVDTEGIFRAATRGAASRAHEVASGLHVNVGGLEIGAEIAIRILEIEEDDGSRPAARKMQIRLAWEGAKSPRLFPVMRGTLAVYPLTLTETQLDFGGTYDPPLGPLGGAIDSVVGHRIAEASVHRFVTDVAEYLRRTLEPS